MLSCSCPEWDSDSVGTWCFLPPNDFVKFSGNRRKRCSSCNQLIDIGADCLEFMRERSAYTEIEQRICGEEIPIASLFMCERCGEIYLNLEAVGYCFSPCDGMEEALHEYWELTGFKPIDNPPKP